MSFLESMNDFSFVVAEPMGIVMTVTLSCIVHTYCYWFKNQCSTSERESKRAFFLGHQACVVWLSPCDNTWRLHMFSSLIYFFTCLSFCFLISIWILTDQHMQWLLLWLFHSKSGLQTKDVDRSLDCLVILVVFICHPIIYFWSFLINLLRKCQWGLGPTFLSNEYM